MRQIKLDDYEVMVPDVASNNLVPKPYRVKESLVACLLHPVLNLTGRELLLRNKLAMSIEEAGGSILLEESDYRKLKQAIETIKGFTKTDMELVRRVLEAEEIEVEVKTG